MHQHHRLISEVGNGDVDITATGLAYLESDVVPTPQATEELLAP